MIVGLCDATFPDVGRILARALPGDEVTVISPSDTPRRVDVVVPLGARVDAVTMDACRPRLIQQFGVGLQGVDLDAARRRGIPVANVPAAETGNAVAVAEVAILHVLLLLRRYDLARRSIADRLVGEPTGNVLAGKTAAVIGVGAIGGLVMRRLSGLDARPIGVGRAAEPNPETAELGPYYPVAALTDALSDSRLVIVCCPLTPQTRGLVGRDQLAAMPPGGYLVNVSRGGVVDYDALLQALRSGHLAGAGLDVFWDEPIDPGDPLLGLNVTTTPHIGGVTEESYAAMAAAFAANIERLRAGKQVEHRQC